MQQYLNKIIQGDCLEVMQGIPDKSINLIVTDPPYNIGKAQWDKIPNYIEWCGKWLIECQRVLRDNGSFYFFHNDFLQIVDLQKWIEQNTEFVFKQLIVWNKRFKGARNKGFLDGFVETGGLRNYQQMVEYCLFYTFQDETGLTTIYSDRQLFKPIRDYMLSELKKSSLSKKEINKILGSSTTGGGMACHFFGNTDQWTAPTKEMYKKLQTTGYFQREYEDLRREYEDLRYTFNNQKTHHSVWNYEVAPKLGHITPKPIEMIENIILHSSNEGDIILDPFLGSGTTAIAALNTGRFFIGIEREQDYINIARKRVYEAQAQQSLRI